MESLRNEEELKNLIKEIDKAGDLDMSAKDEQKRAKVQATLCCHIYKAMDARASIERIRYNVTSCSFVRAKDSFET